MKIIFLLFLVALSAGIFLFFQKKEHSEDTVLHYGPFTIKMKVTSDRTLNQNYKWVTETIVSYSIWYKNEIIKYPASLNGKNGYSSVWRVYVLEGAPKPTLIAGSVALFMINEDKGNAIITPFDEQNDVYASLQYLDSANGQPGKEIQVYTAHKPESIDTLKGSEYLLINQRLVLHIPDLKLRHIKLTEEQLQGYHIIKAGGALGFSPDKKTIVFMGGLYDNDNKYQYAMIECGTRGEKLNIVPYTRTKTRSVNLNYENRDWFKTYFEWTTGTNNHSRLQLKKYETLPPWEGSFKDYDKVYQLTPVKNELQQVFADFILKELNLKKEDIHPGEQYSSNMMVIWYNKYKFKLWLRPAESILVLMMDDLDVPEASAGILIIHQLGERFNKELKSGKYQENFTQLIN
jgi:hypothetical protein